MAGAATGSGEVQHVKPVSKRELATATVTASKVVKAAAGQPCSGLILAALALLRTCDKSNTAAMREAVKKFGVVEFQLLIDKLQDIRNRIIDTDADAMAEAAEAARKLH